MFVGNAAGSGKQGGGRYEVFVFIFCRGAGETNGSDRGGGPLMSLFLPLLPADGGASGLPLSVARCRPAAGENRHVGRWIVALSAVRF